MWILSLLKQQVYQRLNIKLLSFINYEVSVVRFYSAE